MAVINFARREIEAKIVYYGPAMSGKTTNVQVVHGIIPDAQRGELHSMATAEERTLFFDYVPIQLGQIAGFTAKFKLFTVPGQVFYKETRRVVLQGADAVVFVADSAPDRGSANIDALIDLEENLRSHGLDLASIPLVIQYNKRDVADARSVQDMQTDLNPFGVPHVEAIAVQGVGVLDTLRAITDLTAQRVRDNLAGRQTAVSLSAVERQVAEDDGQVIREHLERIKRVRPYEEQRGEKLKSGGHVQTGEVDAFLLANVERAGEFLDGKDKGDAKAVVTKPAEPPVGGASAEVTFKSQGPKPPPPPPKVDAPTPAPAKPVTQGPTATSVAAQLAAQRTGMRELPPPPPVPKEEARKLPEGVPLEAVIDPALWGGAVVEKVVGVKTEGGPLRLEVVLKRGGERRTHSITLAVREAAPPAAPEAGPGWLSVVGSGVVLGGVGLLLGIVIGWFVASP